MSKSDRIQESALPEPKRDFSRRRFLQAAGIAMALPAMESVLPRGLRAAHAASASAGMAATASSGARLAATTASGAPLRTAFLYVPNGAIPAAWFGPPVRVSNSSSIRTMKSLEPVKEHIQILGGLDDISAVGGPDGGGEHARAQAARFSRGCGSRRRTGRIFMLASRRTR